MKISWLSTTAAVPAPSSRHSDRHHRRSRPVLVYDDHGNLLWARFEHEQGQWSDLNWEQIEVGKWDAKPDFTEQTWIRADYAVPPASDRHSDDGIRRSRPVLAHTRQGALVWARFVHDDSRWYDLHWQPLDVEEWIARPSYTRQRRYRDVAANDACARLKPPSYTLIIG